MPFGRIQIADRSSAPKPLVSMEIHRLAALSNNYIFLLHDPVEHRAAVVDAGEPYPVLEKLKELRADLVAIFNTHRHGDHVGGNWDLLEAYPQAVVYGGVASRGLIPGQAVFLSEGDCLSFADREIVVMDVPGHTRDHIAYYFPPRDGSEPGDLFSGDVIFAGGCGKLFDGPAGVAVASIDRLRQLPDNTRIWCAHEYTRANLRFAVTTDRANLELQERYHQVRQLPPETPTVPTTMGVERRTNPFLRWDEAAIQAFTGQGEPAAVFAQLRRMKEAF
jgi:hydroxyacylglutathione hydrolase